MLKVRAPMNQCLEFELFGESMVIVKNFPGQRLGAKAWYWRLRDFLSENRGYKWCSLQPCLARTLDSAIMVHVDDIVFMRSKSFWEDAFLPAFKEYFSVSVGTSISFLKRMIEEINEGLKLLRGTKVWKLVEEFENIYGKVRAQMTPCM